MIIFCGIICIDIILWVSEISLLLIVRRPEVDNRKAKIEELLQPILSEKQIKLYDIQFAEEFGFKILRVLIESDNGIDLDSLTIVNDYLSLKLDNEDIIDGEYMLEVSSSGAEKELRNDLEIEEAIGKYVHIEADSEYDGYLEEADPNEISLKINIKGRIKKIKIEKKQIKKIRLAVKF
jgi:ribosome maturation factor RimP